jgi:uncharacterized membrane protein
MYLFLKIVAAFIVMVIIIAIALAVEIFKVESKKKYKNYNPASDSLNNKLREIRDKEEDLYRNCKEMDKNYAAVLKMLEKMAKNTDEK